MWIILLDRSGSMGDPFSGKAGFAGRSRQTQAAVKLDAAKEALLMHLSGMGMPGRIALFEFTSTASLIFEGLSNDRTGIQQALNTLQPYNGTEIAQALNQATAYATRIRDVPIFRVLVISDGLSDRERATQAAQRLEAQGAVIDVILIDPTGEGEAVARAIVGVNGSVTAVTSPEELSEDIVKAGQQQQELARQADAILHSYKQEAKAVVEKEPLEEKLAFTAGYPGTVSLKHWYPLLIYLHLAKLQNEVMGILAQRSAQLGFKPEKTTAQAASRLTRGTWLRLMPRVEGIRFNPLSQEVAWYEDIQEVPFRLQAEPNAIGRSLLGSIEIYAGPVLIAQVPLAIRVRQPGEPTEVSEATTGSGQIFNRVFASYSHQDSPIVDACVAAYKALGIYVYIDKHSLRSGQQWKRVLHQLIEQADCFQLYWSNASSKSPYVEDEWRHALTLTGRKGAAFVRPLYWETEWPAPPPELSDLHFSTLNLESLSQFTGHSLKTPQTSKAIESTTKPAPLPVVVLPVLPGTTPDMQSVVREDVVYAVNFLEETTGLRYYPVPTLLVDEHIVKFVRAETTIDWTAVEDHKQVERILGLTDVLRSISLEFHVRNLHPNRQRQDADFARVFGSGRLLRAEQFELIRQRSEAGPDYLVDQYFRSHTSAGQIDEAVNLRWRDMRDELVQFGVPGFSANQTFLEFLDTFLTVVSNLLREGLQQLGSFHFEGNYAIDTGSWQIIRQEFPGLNLYVERSRYEKDNLLLQGPFSELVRVFDGARTSLVEALRQLTRLGTPLQRFFVANVPTYGIFVSASALAVDDVLKRWAFAQNIPTELTLPQTARALLCLNAHERFEKQLVQDGQNRRKAQQLARNFQRGILVHEHFHAILETGLDAKRQPAVGPTFPDAWQATSGLDESLAAWMELHAAREDPELTELVWNYIFTDDYPTWPYRGAEYIEKVYSQHGIDGVRKLIMSLRNDPESTQLAFDADVKDSVT